jgi:hypothetical protein
MRKRPSARITGRAQAQTFILVANPGDTPTDLTVTFLRTDVTTLVERSLYTSAGGLLWTAGTHSAGTPLEP